MADTADNKVLLSAPIPAALNDDNWRYKFYYELWKRTGGAKSNVASTSSVQEVTNSLNFSRSEQEQINQLNSNENLSSMAYQESEDVDIAGGSIEINDLSVIVNETGNYSRVGGTLKVDLIEIGNIGAGEDTLISYDLLPSTLETIGDYIEVEAWGTFAANANNKRIKLKFGSTVLIDSGTYAANNASWKISSKIILDEYQSQNTISDLITGSSLIVATSSFASATEDNTEIITVSCTGEGVSDNDIIQKGLIIKWHKSGV